MNEFAKHETSVEATDVMLHFLIDLLLEGKNLRENLAEIADRYKKLTKVNYTDPDVLRALQKLLKLFTTQSQNALTGI